MFASVSRRKLGLIHSLHRGLCSETLEFNSTVETYLFKYYLSFANSLNDLFRKFKCYVACQLHYHFQAYLQFAYLCYEISCVTAR